MARIENRGSGAKKIKLERRLDANARLARKALAKPAGGAKPAARNSTPPPRLH